MCSLVSACILPAVTHHHKKKTAPTIRLHAWQPYWKEIRPPRSVPMVLIKTRLVPVWSNRVRGCWYCSMFGTLETPSRCSRDLVPGTIKVLKEVRKRPNYFPIWLLCINPMKCLSVEKKGFGTSLPPLIEVTYLVSVMRISPIRFCKHFWQTLYSVGDEMRGKKRKEIVQLMERLLFPPC